MKAFLHTTIEGLYDMFNGNANQNDEVPYKEKLRSVIGWFILFGFCISMLYLFNNP